ncbi:XRE family transcriptional regulator [Neglecta sp. X4]|uniref:helix-turn-helix domain-containing protein n=1 Tax=unclassified Neglectibacter TaxID=2632164 RepID=UPI001368D473|nr:MULTISPECIES: helix-turn-helix transcriptional regulator [Eubacteriales]NBI18953.1 XRE family transcriptional regulator [Neglectibacter sp. 59]NBJ74629.1 XRE family transcriptional regulator [Neglectibacter sp. X4]NCE82453.1 XRE family transcriptional regulator [Neglectibacter sp. X58]
MNSIRELRKNKGLSQRALADLLEVNQTAVSQWERGVTTPSSHMLLRLSRIFEISPNKLLDIKGAQQEQYSWEDKEVMDAVKDTMSSLIASLQKEIRESPDEYQKQYFDMLEMLRHILQVAKGNNDNEPIALIYGLLTEATRFVDSQKKNAKT